jgi:hypothetical protein
LRDQLIRIQQRNFRHSTLAQVEQSGPSNHNINSDLCTTVAEPRANTITTYVARRGEQNVPKRYLKGAEWLDKDYGWGYYTTSTDSNDDDTLIAIDFDFGSLQWGVTRKLPDNGGFAIERPAPVKLGLRIYDEERVDRSRWGPLDGEADDEEEQPRTEFKFGSDHAETPDENIDIPATDAADAAEEQLEQLASNIPTNVSTKFAPTVIYKASTPASTMASIAATTTVPPATLLGRTTRFTVPSNPFGSGPPPSGPPGGGGGGHWSSRGPPMGGGPPGPPGPPGGGGNPGGHGGGGNPGGGKLVGREPEVFDGTRSKTEGFLQEWNIYYGLNWGADVITTPFTRAMLFLSFIKGPNIQEWVAAQIEWLGDQMAGGAQVHNEYLWRTIIDRFKDAFTDTMSVEKAERAIKEIRMKEGDLDGYIAKFEQLARIAGHDLNAKGTWTMFAEGLPKMLHYNMISQGGRRPNSWQEWTEGAIEQQQKWLYLQTFFNGKVPQKKQGPNQNWRQGQGSGSAKNSNAMDLTPGHIRARAGLTDEERAKLMATGGCFRCRKQGHMSRNCPDKPRQSQIQADQGDDVQIQSTNTTPKKFDAKGLIEQIKELNDEDKDVVIQEVFMKNRQDFS